MDRPGDDKPLISFNTALRLPSPFVTRVTYPEYSARARQESVVILPIRRATVTTFFGVWRLQEQLRPLDMCLLRQCFTSSVKIVVLQFHLISVYLYKRIFCYLIPTDNGIELRIKFFFFFSLYHRCVRIFLCTENANFQLHITVFGMGNLTDIIL